MKTLDKSRFRCSTYTRNLSPNILYWCNAISVVKENCLQGTRSSLFYVIAVRMTLHATYVATPSKAAVTRSTWSGEKPQEEFKTPWMRRAEHRFLPYAPRHEADTETAKCGGTNLHPCEANMPDYNNIDARSEEGPSAYGNYLVIHLHGEYEWPSGWYERWWVFHAVM